MTDLRAAALAGLFAALAVLLFWAVLPDRFALNEFSDYASFYEPVARGLVTRGTLVAENGVLPARFPPLYPLLLAGLFQLAAALGVADAWMVAACGLCCTSVAAVMIFLLARSVFTLPGAMAAAFLFTTYLPVLWLTKQPATEPPFFVLLFAAALLWERARRANSLPLFLACGVLVGAASLLRPIAVGVGVVLALCYALPASRRRLAGAACLLAGNLIAVAPWEAMLWRHTGRLVLLSTAGPQALRDGFTVAVQPKAFRQGISVPEDVRDVMQAFARDYERLTTTSRVLEVLWQQTRERPAAVAKLMAIKAARSWYATDSQRYETPLLALQCGYLLLVGAGAAVAWRAQNARPLVLAIGALVLYFWLMNIFSTTLARYMTPAMGLLFVLCGALVPSRPPGVHPYETTDRNPGPERGTEHREHHRALSGGTSPDPGGVERHRS